MYNKLKELRTNANITIKEMGDKIGISKTYYWQIENGMRNLKYDVAYKIALVFKLKPDDIFYEDTSINLNKEKQD